MLTLRNGTKVGEFESKIGRGGLGATRECFEFCDANISTQPLIKGG